MIASIRRVVASVSFSNRASRVSVWCGLLLIGSPALPAADRVESAPPSMYVPDRPVDSQVPEKFEISEPHAQPIFFPPNPPPLGVDARTGARSRPPHPQSGPNGPLMMASGSGGLQEMRGYEYDPFYAPLSSSRNRFGRFSHATFELNKKQSAQLQFFDDQKKILLDELRKKIASLAHVTPAERRQALEAFARGQTPKIAETETIAEDLRASLASKVNWYDLRQWRLGRGALKDRQQTRSLEMQIVRAAAFYQEGFSPAQRRLLRELSMEMEEEVFAKADDVPTSRYFLFFAPDEARIRRPENLPAAIEARLAEYTKLKDDLKKELDDAIYEQDRALFGSSRSMAAALALKQAPRIAALDELAEQIRRELAQAPGFSRAPGEAELPATLRQRIETWTENQRRLADARHAKVSATARAMRNKGPVIVADPPFGNAKANLARDRQLAAMAAAGQQFDEEHAGELEALNNEAAAISAEIAGQLGPAADNYAVDPSSPKFLGEFLAAQKKAAAEREYDVAVFEPGLSPEQRRLLFGAVIVAMKLPLPGPEMQPTNAPGTIVR